MRLIDLDRSAGNVDIDLSGYHGEMYKRPFTTAQVDWKQLGLLAAKVITMYEFGDEF